LFVPHVIKKGNAYQFKNKKNGSRFIRNLELKKKNLWGFSMINPNVTNKSKFKICVQQIKKAKADQLATQEKTIIM